MHCTGPSLDQRVVTVALGDTRWLGGKKKHLERLMWSFLLERLLNPNRVTGQMGPNRREIFMDLNKTNSRMQQCQKC